MNIAVEDLDEDPQIDVEPEGNMLGGFEENIEITTAVVTFTAVVEDEGSVSRWSLAGPDAGKLQFADPTAPGELTFKKQPDYENARGRRRRQHV